MKNIQILYGPPEEFSNPLYGMPPLRSKILTTILSLILSPIFVSASFIIGTILFLVTHKKIFIIIPLIFAIFFLLSQIIGLSSPVELY